MCGYLEDAVAGGVNDGLAGPHVLFAKFLDDFGAGRGLVADGFAADACFKRRDNFGWKTVLVHRKGLVEPDAGHFPMAGGGVLSGRVRGAFAISAERLRGRGEMR